MSWIDEQLRQDEIEDAREIAYFREHLQPEVSCKFTDGDLQSFMDELVSYYAFSETFNNASDSEIEIDAEQVATEVLAKLPEPVRANFNLSDATEIVLLELDYNNAQ